MRTFALFGAAALAASILASSPVFAWSTEQGTSQDANGTNLTDPDDALKALQDKVDSKSQSNTGFYVSSGVNQWPAGPFANPASPFRYQSDSQSNNGQVPYGWSPMPGFRPGGND
ncbi:MAG: hypothetical protein WBX25_15900 [Rhodomicrobium sp.]